jgi:hypothetical protein
VKLCLEEFPKIDESITFFNHSNLGYVEEIKGFDPSHLFYNHLVSIGLSPTLINLVVSREEENDSHNPNNQEADRDSSDL